MCSYLVQKCNFEKYQNMINEVLFIQSKAGMYPMVFLIHCHEIIGHLGYFTLEENPLKSRILSDLYHIEQLQPLLNDICNFHYVKSGGQVDNTVDSQVRDPWFKPGVGLLSKNSLAAFFCAIEYIFMYLFLSEKSTIF